MKSYKGIILLRGYSFEDLKNICEDSGLRSFTLEIIDRDSWQGSWYVSQEIHTMIDYYLKFIFC